MAAASCTCDPSLEYGPNNAHCPRHGAEVRHWDAWSRGETRCPYCVGLEDLDFATVCDCWQYEREDQAKANPGDKP